MPDSVSQRVQRHRLRKLDKLPALKICACGRRIQSKKLDDICSVCVKQTPEGKAEKARQQRNYREKQQQTSRSAIPKISTQQKDKSPLRP